MSLLNDYKDSLIFEIQKEFWNERGKGARHRLSLVGVDILRKILKDPSDINEIMELFKKEGLCAEITMTDNEFSVVLNIKDCTFLKVRDSFMDKNQQPLSCPLGNAIMNAMDLKSGMAPELLPIVREGANCCKVELAKMSNAAVVGGPSQ